MVRFRRSSSLRNDNSHASDAGARVSSRLDIDEIQSEEKASPNDKLRRRVSLPRRFTWHRERLQLTLQQQNISLKSASAMFIMSFLLFGLSWKAFYPRGQFRIDLDRRYVRPTDRSESLTPIRIPSLMDPVASRHGSFLHRPPTLSDLDKQGTASKDWGGLELRFFHGEEGSRMIYRDSRDEQGIRAQGEDNDDDEDSIDSYYAYDDDYIRSPYTRYDDDEFKDWRKERTCRRIRCHRLSFPSCNRLHEIDITHSVPKYLKEGAYRQVFVLGHAHLQSEEEIIWKQLSFAHYPDYEYFEYIRMDALVSERLTSSRSIVDIFGYCGNSLLSEYVQGGDMETIALPKGGFMSARKLERHYQRHGGIRPLNDIPVSDKLRIALEMAESLALLHGFPDGLLCHDDIQLSQFLSASDGSIKLNDFNRAEAMLYDSENGEYCRYFNGVGRGVHRSPEEYHDRPIGEEIDIYSFGNILYSLLTGLHPFYDSKNDEELRERVKMRDQSPFIDQVYRTGLFAEQKLIDIMERCFAYDPQERPSIFEIVNFLRDAVGANNPLQG